MSDYTGIITFRQKLRHNCRIEALPGIIGNNPSLLPNVASLKFQHECTESEQEEIPADLERLVRDVLNASEPKGAECLLLTRTTKLCQLAEEDFWINLYDKLWKYVLLGPAPKPGFNNSSSCGRHAALTEPSLLDEEDWLIVEATDSVLAKE